MNTSIAVLGLPLSGKTALIDAFERNKGMFEPKMVFGNPVVSMPDVSEMFVQRNYQVSIEGEVLHSLSITEYPGALLKKREDTVSLELMQRSLQSKSSWIIMIDGAWFQSDKEDDIEKNIRKKYARTVVPLVSAYAEVHNGQPPDILFVVSKVSQYLLPYLNEEGKKRFGRIVESAFGGLVSETSKPLILLSDTNIKTSVIAVLALSFLQYRSELIQSKNSLSTEIQTITARKNQLTAKLSIESEKMLKSKSLIRDLEQQIETLNQEKVSKSSQMLDPKTDITMRNLGISLHRLMVMHFALLAGGFESVRYAYDETTEEGCFEQYWSKKAAILNIIIAATVFITLLVLAARHPEIDRKELSTGVIGTVVWGVVAFGFRNRIIKGIGMLGVTGGLMTCFGNTVALICVGLYVIWLLAIGKITKIFDQMRAERLGIPNVRFKDELVRFYDEAVRKG